MVVEPKIRGFICTTAHPKGCLENVKRQIEYIKKQSEFETRKNVLVVGCSKGYGLASRIVCAFSKSRSATVGVMFEKPASLKRTATSGFYNTVAFHEIAEKENLYAKTINSDAFLNTTIERTINLIKADLNKIDLVIYSLAAPRRTMPDLTIANSVLKTVGKPFTNKTINLQTKKVEQVTIEPASEQEIKDTINVMGGQNWFEWLKALKENNAISNDAVTIAYSYIGPELTFPIYKNGTIGRAKQHLLETKQKIEKELKIKSLVSINKALVTQASVAIPVVPLYLTILYKIMKKHGVHEGCVEQMYRLFAQKINFSNNEVELDENKLIRLDDLELKPEIQNEVNVAWNKINNENLNELADLNGYFTEFKQLFGFDFDNVDYSEDVDTQLEMNSIL